MSVRLFEQLDYRFSNHMLTGIHCKVTTFIAEFVRERGRFCKIGDDCIQSSPILQGGSNMTGTDLYVNKPHCAAVVRP